MNEWMDMTFLKNVLSQLQKMNVDNVNGNYVRLANSRIIFEGRCSKCGMKLIKAKVMPRNIVIIKRKKKTREVCYSSGSSTLYPEFPV